MNCPVTRKYAIYCHFRIFSRSLIRLWPFAMQKGFLKGVSLTFMPWTWSTYILLIYLYAYEYTYIHILKFNEKNTSLLTRFEIVLARYLSRHDQTIINYIDNCWEEDTYLWCYIYIDAWNRWMIKQQDCMVSISETIKKGNVSITL